MKLIKGNKHFFLFAALLLLNACIYVSERDMAVGKWRFVEVSVRDTPIFPIIETDFMDLNADSTFHYEITEAKKTMDGTWEYREHTLILKYKKPDTTRVFPVEILSKFDLIFNENEKHFVLKRSQ
jgi:hypothetical protein